MRGVRRFGPAGVAAFIVVWTLVPASSAAHATTLASYSAHGSVNQVYVSHAPPGATLELENASAAVVETGTVDDLGSFLFKDVDAGDGYTVVDGDEVSPPLHVMARDGNTAAVVVRLAASRQRVPIHHDPRRHRS